MPFPFPREKTQTIETQFEILKDLREEVAYLREKLNQLEKKFDERLPEYYYYDYQLENQTQSDFTTTINQLRDKIAALERRLEEESEDPEEFIEKIAARVKDAVQVQKPLAVLEGLTPVESKRIEKIISFLNTHEKLSSTELSDIMGLSRTRCNEYFKLLERKGLVEAEVRNKEKYYRLKS